MMFHRIPLAIIAAGSLWLAASAHAAPPGSLVVADAGSATQQRFMSLSTARSGTAAVRVVRPAAPLRSDSQALRSGFMRIDRARAVPLRRQAALPKPATAAILTPRPAAVTKEDAVLSLFDSGGERTTGMIGRTAGHAWPLPSNVPQKFTSGYGTRKDPFHGRTAFHGGIDIAASVGTPVLASADGVVTEVDSGGRYGKFVRVNHADGTQSSYGHLSAQSVRKGQRVRQGQKLGELGSTGRSTGPHLDYRISRNGAGFDPMRVLAGKQPRAVDAPRSFASNDTQRMERGIRVTRPQPRVRAAMRMPLRASVRMID